ncbi:MAG: TVP38/TMEM64 family protein [Hyphomicrobiales bacterium]
MNDGSETGELPAATAGPVRRFGPIITIILAAAFVYFMGWHEYLSLSKVAEHRDSLRQYVDENLVMALLAYAGIYIAIVAFSLPGGAAATIAGGFLFGWFPAGSVTIFAATIGATALFLAARTSLGDVLREKAGPAVRKLADGFKENAFSYMLFLRLVPAFPFWLVNLAPAFLGVPLGVYVVATFIGIIPGTFAFAFVGAGLDSVIAAQQAHYDACIAANGADACTFSIEPSSLITRELLLAFAALGVVALLPVIVQKIRNKNTN